MSKTKSTAPSTFSKLVNTELRILMTRQGLTQQQLVKMSGVSQPVLSRTIYNNESVLNTNQLEALAEALGDDPSEILRRAEEALARKLAAESVPPSSPPAPTGVPDDFVLAAHQKPTNRRREEDRF